MLGAYENIIRLGRNYGIGATLISQRPQSVNKEVLSQVECLCVLQVNGSHERKALEEWVQEAGADRKLVGELPGLSRGEGYIWSPSWLRTFQRVKFGKKATFDASATPEVGKAAKAAKLSSVDVEALRADLQEVIVSAEKDDPKALRRELAEANRRLREMEKAGPRPAVNLKPDPEAVLAIVQTELNQWFNRTHRTFGVLMAEKIERLMAEIPEKLKPLADFALILKDPAYWENRQLSQEGEKSLKTVRMVETTLQSRQLGRVTAAYSRPVAQPPARRPVSPSQGDSGGSLTGPEQRILNAIAWLETIGVETPEQPAVAFLAGYSYGGGGYNNPRGRLNVAGLLEYLPGDRIRLTDAGRKVAVPPDIQPTNDALHEAVLGRLPGPEQRLLRPLLRTYPSAMHNETLANEAGYAVGSGGFNNPRGRLKTLGLVEYPSPGMVRAKDLLFPEGC